MIIIIIIIIIEIKISPTKTTITKIKMATTLRIIGFQYENILRFPRVMILTTHTGSN